MSSMRNSIQEIQNQKREKYIQGLCRLREKESDEKKDLLEAEKIITEGSNEEKINFSRNQLGNNAIYPPGKIFRFCCNSNIFKEFCKREDLPHVDLWKNTLKANSNYRDVIRSLDGNESLSLLDQCCSFYLYSIFKRHESGEAKTDPLLADICFNLASDMGFYEPLRTRCILNCEKIKNDRLADWERTEAKGQLLNDVKQLGNFYWSLGHMEASAMMRDLGNYYKDSNHEGSEALAHVFHWRSLEHFYYASEISKYKNLAENEKIISAILTKEDLAIAKNQDMWKALESHIVASVKKADKAELKERSGIGGESKPDSTEELRKKIQTAVQNLLVDRKAPNRRQ